MKSEFMGKQRVISEVAEELLVSGTMLNSLEINDNRTLFKGVVLITGVLNSLLLLMEEIQVDARNQLGSLNVDEANCSVVLDFKRKLST